MSDITAALQRAIGDALRTDAGVIAAFGSAPVKVFGIVPPNTAAPYLVLGPAVVDPLQAEGFDLSEIDFPVHVWSRPNPPSEAEAQAIAAAVRVALPMVRPTVGGLVIDALPTRTIPLVDPSDERTLHVIVSARFTTAPQPPVT